MKNNGNIITPFSGNRDKTTGIAKQLELLKSELVEIVQDCEDQAGQEDFIDALSEALESIDDAIDALSDAVAE